MGKGIKPLGRMSEFGTDQIRDKQSHVVSLSREPTQCPLKETNGNAPRTGVTLLENSPFATKNPR